MTPIKDDPPQSDPQNIPLIEGKDLKQNSLKDTVPPIKDGSPQPDSPNIIKGKGLKRISLPENYSFPIKTNYPILIKKDLHIAEIYRVGAKETPVVLNQRKLNPFQTHIDKNTDDIWVDVLLEMGVDVTLAELREIIQIHGKPGESRIISGRVKVDNLPDLEKKVVRMETSRPISKALNNSLKLIKAHKNLFLKKIISPISGINLTGAGVIIGIIDDGCDFDHPNFKKSNGDTRLLFLWDQSQNIPGKMPEGYYGTEFDAESINTALRDSRNDENIHANPPKTTYDLLEYKPLPNAHGTHVMDIAAGSSANLNYLGVAPEAELIFVHLGAPTTPKEVAGEERGTFGSSKYLVDAFNYILEKAGDKPVVINMSLATNGGAHNGKSLTDAMFDNQLTGKKRALVIAAGNAAEDSIHSSRNVSPNQGCEFHWNMPGSEKSGETSWYARYEMEIWYPKSKEMKIEIYKPDETAPLLTCEYDEEQMSTDSDIQPLVLITNSGLGVDAENFVDILVDHRNGGFVPGDWIIRLVNQKTDEPAGDVTFHAWIERNDRYPSMFASASASELTINGIGTAHLPIVVGAYDGSANHKAIGYSSFGPSRNMNFGSKPEISAPGENITSASAQKGNTVPAENTSRFIEFTSSEANGTSMAAPHVSGVIALMFHAAILKGSDDLTVEDVRQALIETAIPLPGKKGVYDPQLGYGRINALEAIKKIIQH